MNYNYRYSIIIPYFNALKTLERLLHSIPLREDIQVIVINDNCCTFSSFPFENYSNVNFISNSKKIKGAGACRNLGLEIAEGKYILFADADDYFTSNAFAIFDEFYPLSKDVVFFSPTSINESKGELSSRHLPYKSLVSGFIKNNNEDIKYKYYVPWSKMIKRELINKNCIVFDEVIASNDVNFSLKVGYYSNSILAVDENVYCVVESSSSLTKTFSLDVVLARFNAFCLYNDFVSENNVNTAKVPMAFFLKLVAKVSFIKFIKCFYIVMKSRYPLFKT